MIRYFHAAILASALLTVQATAADLILHRGKVITVDATFSIHEAIAVTDGKVQAVGRNADILKLRTPQTEVIDLKGRTVIPGLMDSHTHAPGASMTEFAHPLPQMDTIQDVLDYFAARAAVVPEGEWIVLQQVFITRLREQRYPTRAELDRVAPKHAVVFRTGPDASVNTLALQRNNIDRNFKIPEGVPGKVEVDEHGEPTGVLRVFSNYFKSKTNDRVPTEADREKRLLALFNDYNSVGITSISDRSASEPDLKRYQRLRDEGKFTVRVAVSHSVQTLGPMEAIQQQIRAIGQHPLRAPDPLLRLIGIKTFLDGGMLTGSAYMRKPWGVSAVYSITDPEYRGQLFVPRERLLPMVRTTIESGLQFTAHSVGDGAVHLLLDVYDELAREGLPVRQTRSSLTHSNFMSREAVEQAARLGVVMDIQPAWLYLDTHTLVKQFGYDRLRYFQPLRTIFAAGGIAGGGSDHMQKVGSMRSINPYNPFLGIQTAVTRQSKWHPEPLHPEEALTREQALRFYTSNNAYLLFNEHLTGTLESGKFADLAILDTDLLTCPEDKIGVTQVLRTYLAGKLIFQRGEL